LHIELGDWLKPIKADYLELGKEYTARNIAPIAEREKKIDHFSLGKTPKPKILNIGNIKPTIINIILIYPSFLFSF